MTVEELIKKLQKFPPKWTVVINWDYGKIGEMEIDSVELNNDRMLIDIDI